MKCKIIDLETVDWESLDRFKDRTVFQTREWLQFVSETQNAMPVLAELREGGEVVGYFSGLTFTRLGIKVLGSSFPGWTTPYMGFNLLPGTSRGVALAALEHMAWNDLTCLHLEVSDPYFSVEDGQALGFTCEFYTSFRTDLRKSEEEIFKSMDSTCRRCIRKAEKSGVTIEEAHDLAFADEYYEQLKDVFAQTKQFIGTRCVIGNVAVLRSTTGAAKVSTRRNTAVHCIGFLGSRNRDISSFRDCVTRQRKCLSVSSGFSAGCKASQTLRFEMRMSCEQFLSMTKRASACSYA